MTEKVIETVFKFEIKSHIHTYTIVHFFFPLMLNFKPISTDAYIASGSNYAGNNRLVYPFCLCIQDPQRSIEKEKNL